MISRSSLGLTVFAASLLISGAAFALPYTGPTVTVDGITLPVGASFMDTETSYEQLVTTPGQSFAGVFDVASIGEAGYSPTYSYGTNGAYLYGEFTGFTVVSVTPPTSTTAGSVLLTGGQISYYVSPTDSFTENAGTAADLTADALGTLFLSATPEAIDNAGDTLELTLPAGSTTTSFAQATAVAYLDTTGGAAAYNFSSCSETNSYTGQCADLNFQGTANTVDPTADFAVTGSNDIKATVVPEPLTLSLFGAGLVGAAAMRRRKKKTA
jgi:hypothetical protein